MFVGMPSYVVRVAPNLSVLFLYERRGKLWFMLGCVIKLRPSKATRDTQE